MRIFPSDSGGDLSKLGPFPRTISESISDLPINVKNYGAKGDNVTDDTQAFINAMAACNSVRALYIPAGTYKITDTITNNATRVYGEAPYIDSSQKGTLLNFIPTVVSDLKPCLLVNKGSVTISDLSVSGNIPYNVKTLSTYVTKTGFDAQDYSMFSVGMAGIAVQSNGTATIENVRTSNVKAGIFWDNLYGHCFITDCNLNGLIGLLMRGNTSDYGIYKSTIKGAFASIVFGKAGFSANMSRVHLGFSPYGLYQCTIDSNEYDSAYSLIATTMTDVRFERVGEAMMKFLPGKGVLYTRINQLGCTWSTFNTSDSWFSALPDTLVASGSKQKYALDIPAGIKASEFLGSQYGGVLYSPYATGGKDAKLGPLTDNGNLSAIDFNNVDYYRTDAHNFYYSVNPKAILDETLLSERGPVRGGNLLDRPDNVAKWSAVNSNVASITEVTDLSTLPLAATQEMLKYYGGNLRVLKITPIASPTADPVVEVFMLGQPTNTYYKGSLSSRIFTYNAVGQTMQGITYKNQGDNTLRTQYNRYTTANQWHDLKLHNGVLDTSLNPYYISYRIVCKDWTTPTYITIPMVSENTILPYSPTKYPSYYGDVEVGAMVLTPKSSLPAPDVTQRGKTVCVLGTTGVAEVSTLTVTAGCTTNGSVTVTLDGVPYLVALTTSQNTASAVATAIRTAAASYSNWTVGGTGAVVTFTSKVSGARADAVYSAGTTGAAGTIATTTAGSDGTSDTFWGCKKAADDTYTWVQIG